MSVGNDPLRLTHYLAFGSNLLMARLEARIGSFAVVGRTQLSGRSLRYHKAGADGSGKADCFWTGQDSDVVWGMVYTIDAVQRAELAEIEGVGNGYREAMATVRVNAPTGTRELDVFFYEAESEAVRPELLPFDWYREYILKGAQQHRFDPDYVDLISAQQVMPDPDPERSHGHWRLLDETSG